jgi:hypothetical protein
MGMFADLLSFANQGKQSSVFYFRLQKTNGSLPFPFSICSKQRNFPFPSVQYTVYTVMLYKYFNSKFVYK